MRGPRGVEAEPPGVQSEPHHHQPLLVPGGELLSRGSSQGAVQVRRWGVHHHPGGILHHERRLGCHWGRLVHLGLQNHQAVPEPGHRPVEGGGQTCQRAGEKEEVQIFLLFLSHITLIAILSIEGTKLNQNYGVEIST